jgi:serine protease AprX
MSEAIPAEELEKKCQDVGGANIKSARILNQVFCDLENCMVETLEQTEGIIVRQIRDVQSGILPNQGIAQITIPEPAIPSEEYYTPRQLAALAGYEKLRNLFSPPLTGSGCTIVILDTGINTDHESVAGKVVYEADFSGSLSPADVFDHGTGVASVIVGGSMGVAPNAYIWNIKVLNDAGQGTEEHVVLGMEHVLQKRQEAIAAGLPISDPMRPTIVNMSLGGEDDGDSLNPLRVACRQMHALGMTPVAAAGNSGPAVGSIMLPACDPEVLAVGTVTAEPFGVWGGSSRGPTLEGAVKPDFVALGSNVLVASSQRADSYLVKSGTSFSAPVLSGMAALMFEMAARAGQEFDEDSYLQMVVENTIKPTGAPLSKDNDFGYGMPWGQSILESITPPSNLSGLMASLMSVMVVGMMMTTMGGLMKEAG